MNFWFKVLLETEFMNEPEHRKELMFIQSVFK